MAENGEKEDYAIFTEKVTEVIWNMNEGRLVLETERQGGRFIEFPIEHYNTAREFKMYVGRTVKLLVENGKITGLKLI
jgi:hypothetical protein